MNVSYNPNQDSDRENVRDEERRAAEKSLRPRRSHYGRSKRPTIHNGIHRRRNKRFTK